MQRIMNVDKWQVMQAGKAVPFASADARRVRLDVNAPAESTLWYIDGNVETTFLALVIGRDVIEFFAVGEFSIGCEGGDCWCYSIDGEDLSFSIPDAVSFTKVVERRPRNPEFELMRYEMQRNMQRMMDKQRDELGRILSQQRAAAEARAAKSPGAGDGKPAGKKPEPKSAPAGDAVDVDADGSGGATDGDKASK